MKVTRGPPLVTTWPNAMARVLHPGYIFMTRVWKPVSLIVRDDVVFLTILCTILLLFPVQIKYNFVINVKYA